MYKNDCVKILGKSNNIQRLRKTIKVFVVLAEVDFNSLPVPTASMQSLPLTSGHYQYFTRATVGFELFYLKNCKAYSNKNHIYGQIILSRLRIVYEKYFENFITQCNYEKSDVTSGRFPSQYLIRSDQMTRATFGFELFYLENCKVYSNKNHIYGQIILSRLRIVFKNIFKIYFML